jgi:ATP-binding cassette subfamily B protein
MPASRLTGGRDPALFSAALCAVAAGLLSVVPLGTIALALRQAFVSTVALSEVRSLALGVGFAVAAQILVSVVAGRLVRRQLAARSEALRVDTIDRLRDVPAAQLDGLDAGRTVALLTTGIDDANEAQAVAFDQMFRGAIAAVASLAIVAAIDWRIALIVLAFLPVTAGYLRQSRRVSARATPVFARARAEGSSRFFEYLESIALLRAFGWTSERTRRLAWALNELNITVFETAIAPLSMGTISLFYVDFAFAISLIAAATIGIARSSPEAYVLAFVLALGYFATLFEVVDGALRLQAARANFVEVEYILGLAAAVPPGSDVAPSGALAIENVDFAFDRQPVLRDVSHRFAERSVTAVVGRSSAGKSALAVLLAGLRSPSSGKVTVGGIDLASLSRGARARTVTIVLQDTALSDGTIAQNIAAGRPGASDAEIRAAADAAECGEFLERLPEGIATPVRAGGAAFSLGERQRIAVARALLSDAPIVVFDECTASLDPDAESAVHRAIQTLARTKTVVLITHRLASAQDADQILVVAGNTITQRGTHAALLTEPGPYATLWQAHKSPAPWHPTPN